MAIARDLPLAVDLMAACSQAGLPIQAILPHVARAVGGPLQSRLDVVSARWELGASLVEEWERLANDPQLRGLGHAMMRAHRSGSPVAEALNRLAVDARRERRTRLQSTARSVGVKAAAPLAACFLPAFMAIGVVPTVVGGFTHLGL
jgi:pilus assembly protein TadC